jgi:hypothetical protein
MLKQSSILRALERTLLLSAYFRLPRPGWQSGGRSARLAKWLLAPRRTRSLAALLAVQTVLATGSVVAVDEASRAPPLSAPVKAEFFGERADIRTGAARRQRFSVSLFDEDTARRLGRWKAAMSARLAACSLTCSGSSPVTVAMGM